MSELYKIKYPALYDTANVISGDSQDEYLRVIKAEYVLLILASITSLSAFESKYLYILTTVLLFISLIFMIVRNWYKPEKDWYRGRALAESIKTTCWKYCMRADPFGDVPNVKTRRAQFRSYLSEILSASDHIADKMEPGLAAEDQITKEMDDIRALNLEKRKNIYEETRIREQRLWYAVKASKNKKASKRWWIYGIAMYTLAIVCSSLRIFYFEANLLPIEPIIVIASSMLGWTQVKKFNELSASYTLTAHEIGIMLGKFIEIDGEEAFSKFVNEAEQAFSREHTQWVARQHTP